MDLNLGVDVFDGDLDALLEKEYDPTLELMGEDHVLPFLPHAPTDSSLQARPPSQQNPTIPPPGHRVVPKATGKHLAMAAQKMCRQPLPLEEHHVVLKESSKQLTAATEIYGDYVQCIFGRVTCMSVSQVRHLKALQDAFNRCKLGTDNQDPLPPVSFWVRKDKAQKQDNWAHDFEEVRYRILRNKQVYFVQASDDCLRHDIRNSGDPMRGAHRQFKRLMKLFSAVPDKAPSSIAMHMACPSSCTSSVACKSPSNKGKDVQPSNVATFSSSLSDAHSGSTLEIGNIPSNVAMPSRTRRTATAYPPVLFSVWVPLS